MPNQSKFTEYTAVPLKINCKTCMHILLHSFHNNMSITVRIRFGLWKYKSLSDSIYSKSELSKNVAFDSSAAVSKFLFVLQQDIFYSIRTIHENNDNFLLLFHFIHVCYNRAGPKALSLSIVLIWVAIGNMDHNRGCMCLGVSYRIRKPTQ